MEARHYPSSSIYKQMSVHSFCFRDGQTDYNVYDSGWLIRNSQHLPTSVLKYYDWGEFAPILLLRYIDFRQH